MKKLFIFLGLLIVSYYLLNVYVDIKLSQKQYNDGYNDCHKIWSARGLYHTKELQNTIRSFNNAYKNGAKGAEVDVRYVPNMQKFIVSHDNPVLSSNGELQYTLKNNKILTLEELFANTPHDLYWWLDFKKLRMLDDIQTKQAIARLNAITEKNNNKDKIYIEGEHPFKLKAYQNGGFKVIFDIRPLPNNNILSSTLLHLYKAVFYFGGYDVMAIKYGKPENPYNHIYGDKAINILEKIPLFVYHVFNDKNIIKQLNSIGNVKVFMMGVFKVGDDYKSLNQFDMGPC